MQKREGGQDITQPGPHSQSIPTTQLCWGLTVCEIVKYNTVWFPHTLEHFVFSSTALIRATKCLGNTWGNAQSEELHPRGWIDCPATAPLGSGSWKEMGSLKPLTFKAAMVVGDTQAWRISSFNLFQRWINQDLVQVQRTRVNNQETEFILWWTTSETATAIKVYYTHSSIYTTELGVAAEQALYRQSIIRFFILDADSKSVGGRHVMSYHYRIGPEGPSTAAHTHPWASKSLWLNTISLIYSRWAWAGASANQTLLHHTRPMRRQTVTCLRQI